MIRFIIISIDIVPINGYNNVKRNNNEVNCIGIFKSERNSGTMGDF